MKKLMFAAAALVVGVVMADGITSANIVGYQNMADDSGINPVAAAFTPVGAASWSFAEKVFDTPAVVDDVVQKLNFDIFTLESYSFLGYDKTTKQPKGWSFNTFDPETGDDIITTVMDFTCVKGETTYTTTSSGETLTSGEVEDLTATIPVEFEGDVCVCFANPFPQETTIADLETFCGTDDVFQKLNFDTFDFDSYMFLGFDKTTGSSKGWTFTSVDAETGDDIYEVRTDATEVLLKAGEGGFITTAKDRTWNVTLKSAK